jgi:hypothetical protein
LGRLAIFNAPMSLVMMSVSPLLLTSFSSLPSRDAKKAKNIKDLSERFLIAQSIKSSDN